MTDRHTIEIEPKRDEFFMDNVRYSIPRPTLRATIRKWNDKRRLRHAMKVVKRLFEGSVPHIEDAHTVELVECEGGCWLRICMPGTCPESVKERVLKAGER